MIQITKYECMIFVVSASLAYQIANKLVGVMSKKNNSYKENTIGMDKVNRDEVVNEKVEIPEEVVIYNEKLLKDINKYRCLARNYETAWFRQTTTIKNLREQVDSLRQANRNLTHMIN